MALFQLLPDIFVPTFEIKVDGSPLKEDVAKSVLEVSVTEHLGPPSQFSFRLNDPKMDFVKQQSGLFTEGKRVEISIGYVGKTRAMIVGEISALSADFPNSGPVTLLVEGFDLLHRLTRGTIYRTFGWDNPDQGMPHKEIVSTIVEKEAKLKLSVDPKLTRTEPVVQDHKTNLAFLEELAESDGYFLWIDGETVHFESKPPDLKSVSLEWGKTLMSFSPRLSTAGQVNAVEVRGWDPNQKQEVSARVESSGGATAALASTGKQQIAQGTGGKSERVIEDVRITSAQAARDLAEKILLEQQQSLITGNGTSVGEPDIRMGTILELSGIGRFEGEYRVEQVTHTVGEGGYQTSFQVKRKL